MLFFFFSCSVQKVIDILFLSEELPLLHFPSVGYEIRSLSEKQPIAAGRGYGLFCPATAKKPAAHENPNRPRYPRASRYSQADTAATVPSDTAVVSWRTFFRRQSPATNSPGVPETAICPSVNT